MAIQPNTLDESAKAYSQTSDELMSAYASFFEKIALYSGGIISISITFIGYLLSKDATVLLQEFLGFHLYWLIFLAWALLFLSLMLGIYIRLFSATHMSKQMHSEWVKFFEKDRKEALQKIKSGEMSVNGISEEELPSWLLGAEDTVNQYSEAVKKSEKSVRIYDFISLYIRKVAVTLFILGCLAILLFVALSILGIVNLSVT